MSPTTCFPRRCGTRTRSGCPGGSTPRENHHERLRERWPLLAYTHVHQCWTGPDQGPQPMELVSHLAPYWTVGDRVDRGVGPGGAGTAGGGHGRRLTGAGG